MAMAASMLGVLVEHLGPRREVCVGDAVPALLELLQTEDAEEGCGALLKIIKSRPADKTESMRIIEDGGFAALMKCRDPTVGPDGSSSIHAGQSCAWGSSAGLSSMDYSCLLCGWAAAL